MSNNHNHPACSVPGCERQTHAKGMCELHYRRLRDTGSVVKNWYHPRSGVCSVVGCRRDVRNRGLCARHYSRWLSNHARTTKSKWHLWGLRQIGSLNGDLRRAEADSWDKWILNKVRDGRDRTRRLARPASRKRAEWNTWYLWALKRCLTSEWKQQRDEWQKWCERRATQCNSRCPQDYRIRVEVTAGTTGVQMLFNWA